VEDSVDSVGRHNGGTGETAAALLHAVLGN